MDQHFHVSQTCYIHPVTPPLTALKIINIQNISKICVGKVCFKIGDEVFQELGIEQYDGSMGYQPKNWDRAVRAYFSTIVGCFFRKDSLKQGQKLLVDLCRAVHATISHIRVPMLSFSQSPISNLKNPHYKDRQKLSSFPFGANIGGQGLPPKVLTWIFRIFVAHIILSFWGLIMTVQAKRSCLNCFLKKRF